MAHILVQRMLYTVTFTDECAFASMHLLSTFDMMLRIVGSLINTHDDELFVTATPDLQMWGRALPLPFFSFTFLCLAMPFHDIWQNIALLCVMRLKTQPAGTWGSKDPAMNSLDTPTSSLATS